MHKTKQYKNMKISSKNEIIKNKELTSNQSQTVKAEYKMT